MFNGHVALGLSLLSPVMSADMTSVEDKCSSSGDIIREIASGRLEQWVF